MLSSLNGFWRLLVIIATFERTGALKQLVLAKNRKSSWGRILLILVKLLRPFGLKGNPKAAPVTRAILALGASTMKFGQLWSTRPDIVGEHIGGELQKLQEDVPPFSMQKAQAIVELQTGRELKKVFSHFDKPIAAASVAQVHFATERDSGRHMAVKLLRPGIKEAFARDVDALRLGARIITRLFPKTRRLRLSAVIDQFAAVAAMEADLRLEAASMSQYAENARHDKEIIFPKIFWRLTNEQMLAMGRLSGISLHDHAALDAVGIDKKQLAINLIRIFLRHALRDGFFHADMHPGNIRVADDGRIILFDFGIMGRIDPAIRRTYAEILYGFLERDYERVARAHAYVGYIPQETDLTLFAHALRSIGDPIFDNKASELDMGSLLWNLFKLTERFGMETRPELLLLQRTMVVVEGVARSLDPDVDIWQAARPEVSEWIEKNTGPRVLLSDMHKTALAISHIAPHLPAHLEKMERQITQPKAPASNTATNWRLLPWIITALALMLAFWQL